MAQVIVRVVQVLVGVLQDVDVRVGPVAVQVGAGVARQAAVAAVAHRVARLGPAAPAATSLTLHHVKLNSRNFVRRHRRDEFGD